MPLYPVSPSATPRQARLFWLLDNISPVIEEIEKSGCDDFECAYKDASGNGSFPKFNKFAEEWKKLCGSFSGRFEMYLVVSVVVVVANYAISRMTGVLENPLTRELSMAPAVFIFYSLLTSFFFSYVIPSVQDPVCGLNMILSTSKRGKVHREMFIDIWKKAESLPASYMQMSLLESVVIQALAFNRNFTPRFFEASELFVWTAFLLGSIPLIATFNALQREVEPVLAKRNPKSNGR
ncbi:hypothetical protein Agabi119p4_3805 [Agaricus bisporus var. burnettii]|uniref:Uncharacterized protein n=1 Tax=Agaricus bisporus var. burnettii TaxID=192524 RepID=A0A8H7F5E0_AGABI|nr:hypothetical protein Agabi119p4_3805 [Agaricus bisporus var. burnettii]